MTYSIPSPTNATYVARSKGRSDTIHAVIGSLIEEPKFVDNAIHHAIYETSSVGDTTSKNIKIKKPVSSDFIMTHERRYRYAEEDSALRLSHTNRNSMPFFNGQLLNDNATIAPLLFDADTHALRLKTDRVINTEFGARMILTNMRGKSLEDYGMGDTTHFRIGQIMSVGLRTTDLIQKLFKDSLHGLNSVTLSLPIKPSNASATSVNSKHSKTFLAKDFYSSSIPAAVRAVARHDHYSLFHDRFGNFIYAPKMFKVVDREIGQKRGAGGIISDPITEAANRIMLEGKSQAVNDMIEIIIDDVEMQKKEGVIRQMRISDNTVSNKMAARKTANQYLRLNRKAQGVIKSEQHARSWDLQPGEVVKYDAPSSGVAVNKAIIELTHESTGESSFQLASYETGLEGVINAFANDKDMTEDDKGVDRTKQVTTLEKSGIGRTQFRVRMAMVTRTLSVNTPRLTADDTITHTNASPNIHAGFIVGHRHADMTGASRGAIGSGYSKRITSASSFSSTTITVATGATDGFPTAGNLTLIYINRGSLVTTGVGGYQSGGSLTYSVATVAYTGKSATTFTGVTILAPNGGTIPATISEIKLLRPRGHEVRTTKTLKKMRMI